MRLNKRSGMMMAAVVAGLGLRASAAPFALGDLAIYQVGTGSAALSSGSTAVFIDEYTPTGMFVQSIPMPTAVSGSNNPLTASGTASSEGNLSLSGNGQDLVFTGYAAAPGVASIAGTSTTSATPTLRDIGLVNAQGAIDTSTTTTAFSGNNPRSAASPDGVSLYAAGANTGIINLIDGSTGTAGTLISSSVTNNRVVNVFNGQLYVSTGSGGTYRIAAVGAGLPTTTGQTYSEVAGVPINTSTGTPVVGPYEYLFASSTDDAGLVVGTGDTGAIEKFILSNGSYQADGFVGLNASTGLTAIQSDIAGVETETLYATTPSGLYELTDSGLGALTGTPSEIATAGANEAFRGIALAPTAAVPEPASIGLMSGALFLLGRRRRNRA
jgi:hypothetical protein